MLEGKEGRNRIFKQAIIFPFCSPFLLSDVVKKLRGKRWWKEDGDIFSRAGGGGGLPASIKKARDLFSARVRCTLAMKYFLWDEREVFLKFQMGSEVGQEILKERKVIKGRGRRWEEKQLGSVEEFYVRPTSKPVSIFLFPGTNCEYFEESWLSWNRS